MQQPADTISLMETLSKKQLVIIVDVNNYHESFQCKPGLNVWERSFDTTTSVYFAGTYLIDINNMLYGIKETMCRFAYATIPEDAKICVCTQENGVEWYRVDRFIVTGEFRHVRSYYDFDDYEFCKEAVGKNPRIIALVETKTEEPYELYQIAIESDCAAILDIPEEHRTFELCMQVVKECAYFVSSLKSTAMTFDQYIEVWLEAAKRDCEVINWAPPNWQSILWTRYNEL